MWNHSVALPISNANPAYDTNGNFPNRAIFPVDDESEKNICIIFENKKGKSSLLTLLDRQMTGHIEHPKVQQQHRQPQNSQRTLTGRFFRKVTLTRVTVALNSSGATRACNPEGNSVSKRLDKPNLSEKKKRESCLVEKNLENPNGFALFCCLQLWFDEQNL